MLSLLGTVEDVAVASARDRVPLSQLFSMRGPARGEDICAPRLRPRARALGLFGFLPQCPAFFWRDSRRMRTLVLIALVALGVCVIALGCLRFLGKEGFAYTDYTGMQFADHAADTAAAQSDARQTPLSGATTFANAAHVAAAKHPSSSCEHVAQMYSAKYNYPNTCCSQSADAHDAYECRKASDWQSHPACPGSPMTPKAFAKVVDQCMVSAQPVWGKTFMSSCLKKHPRAACTKACIQSYNSGIGNLGGNYISPKLCS